MHAREGGAGRICADGDEPQVERASQVADLLELRAAGQMGVLGAVVVDAVAHLGYGAVARVAAEPDRPAAGVDGPGAPQSLVAVEESAGGVVLGREAGDARGQTALAVGLAIDFDGQVGILPPVHLGDMVEAPVAEPLLQAQANKEVHIGKAGLDVEEGVGREVVVVAMADDNSINLGKLVDIAGNGGVAARAEVVCRPRGAARFEDWVEEDSQARGELDIVAGVAQPGGADAVS